jgi:hypothetical protein
MHYQFRSRPEEADNSLLVQFRKELVDDNYRTKTEGKPVCVERDFITIFQPGLKAGLGEIYNGPVKDDHKHRFPDEWKRFEETGNGDDVIEGTPLKEVTSLKRDEINRLELHGIKVVEQAADAPEKVIMALGMGGRSIIDRCKAYMAKISGEQAQFKMIMELQNKVEELEGKLEAKDTAKTEVKASKDASEKKAEKDLEDLAKEN